MGSSISFEGEFVCTVDKNWLESFYMQLGFRAKMVTKLKVGSLGYKGIS